MNPALVPFLAVEALAFAIWAWIAFRTLLRLRRAAIARAGRAWPGPVAQLSAFRDLIRAPEFARDRRALATASLGLVVAMLAFALALGRFG